MKRIIKGKEPLCLLKHRLTKEANYDNYHPKEPLKKALLIEQGYICCYCMRRISIDIAVDKTVRTLLKAQT